MSPYTEHATSDWKRVTKDLLDAHPLQRDMVREVVLASWDDIFHSNIGQLGFRIGTDIFPTPQIMGFLLHELVALNLTAKFPGIWRGDKASNEKDLVHLPDDQFSIELKTSSNGNNVYGNRSYAQVGKTKKKLKDGYFITVNFEKFDPKTPNPRVRRIRFGWLDHSDWLGQEAATGQQARLPPEVRDNKFELLYSL